MKTKICSKCKRELPLENFGWRNKEKGVYRADCKECHSAYVKSKYQERKKLIQELKSKTSCMKCGESRGHLLDYHHLDPSIKENTIARLTSNTSSLQKIEEEIGKCIVLCANCHRDFHYLKNKNGITIQEYLSK